MTARPRSVVLLAFLLTGLCTIAAPPAHSQFFQRLGDHPNVRWIISAGATRFHPEGRIEKEYTNPDIKEGPLVPLLGMRFGFGIYAERRQYLSARALISYETRRASREVSGVFPEDACLCNLEETRTSVMTLHYVVASVMGRLHPVGHSGPFLGLGPSLAMRVGYSEVVPVTSPSGDLYFYGMPERSRSIPRFDYETRLETGFPVRCFDLTVEPTLSWNGGVRTLKGPFSSTKSRVLGFEIAVHR